MRQYEIKPVMDGFEFYIHAVPPEKDGEIIIDWVGASGLTEPEAHRMAAVAMAHDKDDLRDVYDLCLAVRGEA